VFGVATHIHSSIKAAMMRMHSVQNWQRSKESDVWWDANRSSSPSASWCPKSARVEYHFRKYREIGPISYQIHIIFRSLPLQ
jgi:hypothetical protein